MIEKRLFVDQIMVNEQNHVHVRKRTEIIENGEVVAKTFFRYVLTPGDSLDSHDEKVQQVCRLCWNC